MLTLLAGIAPELAPPHNERDPATIKIISAAAATYSEARDGLDAQVPDGWRMLSLRRELDV